MELSKEDFEKILSQKLQSSESKIIGRIDDAQEELARIIADTIAAPFTKRFNSVDGQLDDVSLKLSSIYQEVSRLGKELTRLSKRTKEDAGAFVKDLLKLRNRVEAMEKEIKKLKLQHAV
jgi:predicted  nucleic acid-binding Zn-ribbon protein